MESSPHPKNRPSGEYWDFNFEVLDLRREKRRNRSAYLRDLTSVLHLCQTGEISSALNFAFTKLFVPVGEGAKGVLFRNLRLLDLLKKFPDALPIPNIFEMETTTVCNKKCKICEFTYWKKEDQVRRHMNLAEFRHIVAQFPSIRWVNLTGEGSAFLNKDYPGMLKHLWETHRSSIWLVDHLTDVSGSFLGTEVFPYIHGLYVSMDGATAETYEKIKCGCHFQKVIDNLRFIIEYKRKHRTPFPHLSFRFVITAENVHEMPAFIDLLNSIASPGEWGGSTSMIEYVGLLGFPEIADLCVEKIPRTIIQDMLKRNDKIRFYFGHAEETSNPSINCCPAWVEPYIMLPGYVLPCCAVMMSNNRPMLRRYSFGNVLEKSMRDIWSSEYYMRFRSTINDPDAPVARICVGCRAFRTQERVARNGIWDHLAKP